MITSVLKWPLVALATVGLSCWFNVAFFYDNNHEWWTSDAVQIVTGVGALVGVIAMAVMTVLAGVRAVRRRRSSG